MSFASFHFSEYSTADLGGEADEEPILLLLLDLPSLCLKENVQVSRLTCESVSPC